MLATWGCTTFPKPTLSLDFLGATSLDSRITFSRGSQATLFDSTGTLVYAKHNLLLQSQDFTTTWINDGTTDTANTDIAPDGTLTADTVTALNDSSTGNTRVEQQNIAVISGQNYVFSIFVKNGTVNYIQLFASSGQFGSNAFANFDLTGSGSVGTVGSSATATITAVANGFFRITLSAPATASGNAVLFVQMVASSTAARGASLTRTGQTVVLWGAQLNLANMEGGVTSSLTTYYPTTTAAYYAPRFDYDPSTLQPRGLLIEEQRTNSIRNNTMQGAVAGTPGTAPTNWFVTAASGNLTSVEIVGIGAESGITYIDIRFVTSGAVNPVILFESTTQIVAANGQTWTSAIYNKLVNGSLTNVTVNNRIQYRDATGANLQAVDVVVTPTSAALSTQRNFNTATATNASTARITNGHLLTISAAADFTLRIGLPQLEQGAFATSVIPTTTTALTRNADVATMTGTNFSSWYNQTEGALFADWSVSQFSGWIASISDGTDANRIFMAPSATAGSSRCPTITTTSSEQAACVPSNPVANTVNKWIAAYKVNDVIGCANGTLTAQDTSASIPTVTQFALGNRPSGAAPLNGWLRRIAYYPTRLPNATLQALTA